MKQILIILSILLGLIVGCKKDEVKPVETKATVKSCSVDINKFTDILWIPNDNALFADLKFYASGVQYQSGQTDVTWELNNGCDSVKVNRGSTYYYRISSVTNDTLKLINPIFGLVIYHK